MDTRFYSLKWFVGSNYTLLIHCDKHVGELVSEFFAYETLEAVSYFWKLADKEIIGRNWPFFF